MNEQQAEELARLSVAKGKAELAAHAWNFTNCANLTAAERHEVLIRGATLRAAVVEATAAYRGFMTELARSVEAAARAHYARTVGTER